MESGHLSLPTKQQSFGRISTDSDPSRTGSMSFSHGVVDLRVVEDIQDEIDAQAGDSGRRAWSEDGFGGSCRSLRFSIEELRRGDSGVVPFPDESLVQLNEFWIDGASVENVNRSPLSPLQSEIVSPLSSDGILCSKDGTQNRTQERNTTQQVSSSSLCRKWSLGSRVLCHLLIPDSCVRVLCKSKFLFGGHCFKSYVQSQY